MRTLLKLHTPNLCECEWAVIHRAIEFQLSVKVGGGKFECARILGINARTDNSKITDLLSRSKMHRWNNLLKGYSLKAKDIAVKEFKAAMLEDNHNLKI